MQKLNQCPSARPRYAALFLFDENHPIEAITNYGSSFAVLNDRVKLNTLYNPYDSMAASFRSEKSSIEPCTFHHLEYLLKVIFMLRV